MQDPIGMRFESHGRAVHVLSHRKSCYLLLSNGAGPFLGLKEKKIALFWPDFRISGNHHDRRFVLLTGGDILLSPPVSNRH